MANPRTATDRDISAGRGAPSSPEGNTGLGLAVRLWITGGKRGQDLQRLALVHGRSGLFTILPAAGTWMHALVQPAADAREGLAGRLGPQAADASRSTASFSCGQGPAKDIRTNPCPLSPYTSPGTTATPSV